MKIIDNFLPQAEFTKLQKLFLGPDLPWYYSRSIAKFQQGLDQFQLCHSFFDISKPADNNFTPILQPLLKKLKYQYLFRIKANLRPRTSENVISPFHRDMEINHRVAILYLNTNNGSTIFKDDTIEPVESVANRLLTFDGTYEHAGTSATNCNNRIVLNINYTVP